MKNTNRGKMGNDKKPGQAGFRTPAGFKFQQSDPFSQKGKKNFNANFANQKHRIPRSK